MLVATCPAIQRQAAERVFFMDQRRETRQREDVSQPQIGSGGGDIKKPESADTCLLTHSRLSSRTRIAEDVKTGPDVTLARTRC